MTKLYPTTADTTLTKSNRRKLKLNPNIMNNPHTESQIQNIKATTEIDPTIKNSNDTIPSEHKRNDNNIFSAVTRGNSNPEQSPDVCHKKARSKRFQEISLPTTTGGAPPITARIYELEEINGEEEESNRRVSRRTDLPKPMATVQLTVLKSERAYLNAEVFPINAGYELREEGIQLQVWDVWLHPEMGRNIREKEPTYLTSVLSGVLSCNQTANGATEHAVRRKIAPDGQIARQPLRTRCAADQLIEREDYKCEEEEENRCQEVGRDDWPENHPVLFCDTALYGLVVRFVPARCHSKCCSFDAWCEVAQDPVLLLSRQNPNTGSSPVRRDNRVIISTASGEDLCGSVPARHQIHQHIDYAWSRSIQDIDKFKYGGDMME